MKKAVLAIILLPLILAAFLVIPWPSYAGGANVSLGFSVRIGTPYAIVRHPHWIGPRVYYWREPVPVAPYFYFRIPAVIIVEKGPVYTPPDQPQENYWYYCPESQAYYPEVKSCPGGWLKVVPPKVPPDADPRP